MTENIPFHQHTSVRGLIGNIQSYLKQKGSKDINKVTLSTIHGAKGKGWKHVFILDLYDENLGRNGALNFNEDEEFRIFYVSITRAKYQNHLYLLRHEAKDRSFYSNEKIKVNVEKHKYKKLRFLP